MLQNFTYTFQISAAVIECLRLSSAPGPQSKKTKLHCCKTDEKGGSVMHLAERGVAPIFSDNLVPLLLYYQQNFKL